MYADHARSPLFWTLSEIGALWAAAIVGLNILFPAFGLDTNYDISPSLIALYFAVWLAISLYVFWDIFSAWLPSRHHLWRYGLLGICYGIFLWGALDVLARLPLPAFAQYNELLFATPWYFLPKAAEIMVQQVLIAALVLSLHARFRSMRSVVIGYLVCFAGSHVVLYLLLPAPTLYAGLMVLGAVLSTLIFPYYILRVRDGLLYCFMMHLTYYVVLALLLHAWPAPPFT